MQPTRNTRSENIRAQPIALPNEHPAIDLPRNLVRQRQPTSLRRISPCAETSEASRSRTLPQGPVERSEPVEVSALHRGRPSAIFSARRATSELRDQIEAWINEAGGEENP
ncbi:hypothetical protein SAMN05444161_5690 [Rhizobiales bacterium GAS191]|nr:hypothetical protein SAMN05519103_04886 [Rhizobiales bacterium GAS113]SEE41504.1 hypothetical protein SAMN05444161_5690 [Rhizobiales bacterium GAS191]